MPVSGGAGMGSCQPPQEIADQRRNLGAGILLQEMPAGHQMWSLGLRQQVFEA